MPLSRLTRKKVHRRTRRKAHHKKAGKFNRRTRGGVFRNLFRRKPNTDKCTSDTCITIEDLGIVPNITSDAETSEEWYNKTCKYIYYKLNSENALSIKNKNDIEPFKMDFLEYLSTLENQENVLYSYSDVVDKYVKNLILNHFKKYGKINDEHFYIDNPKMSATEYSTFNNIQFFDKKRYDTGVIGRFLSDVIQITRKYQYDDSKYINQLLNHKFDAYTLNNDNKVYICNNIYSMIDNISKTTPSTEKNIAGFVNDTNMSGYHIVLSPEYFPIKTQKYSELPDSDIIYNYYDPYDLVKPPNIYSKYLNEISFIKDAFKNKAVYVIDPRLAYLLYYQMRTLCGEYFSKLFINFKNIDEITILTLLKYAAMKRFTWTKNPTYAAQVYLVDPYQILNELSMLDDMLPYRKNLPIDDFKEGDAYFILNDSPDVDIDILYTLSGELSLENVPYSNKYTKEQFLMDINKELQNNQQWLCKCVKYENYNNVKTVLSELSKKEFVKRKFKKEYSNKNFTPDKNNFTPDKNNFNPAQKIKIRRSAQVKDVILEKISQRIEGLKEFNTPTRPRRNGKYSVPKPPTPPPPPDSDEEEELPEPPEPPSI